MQGMDQASLLLRKQLKGTPEVEASRLTGNGPTSFNGSRSTSRIVMLQWLRKC